MLQALEGKVHKKEKREKSSDESAGVHTRSMTHRSGKKCLMERPYFLTMVIREQTAEVFIPRGKGGNCGE